MTRARTTAPARWHLAGVVVTCAVVGVLIGLAIVTTAPTAGLAEPAAVVLVGLPVVRALLDVAALATVGLAVLPILVGFDRPTVTEPVLTAARRAAMVTSLVWATAALVTLVLQTAELHPGENVSLASVVGYVAEIGAGKALLLVAGLALVSFALSVVAVRVGEAVPAELRAAVALFALLPLPVTGHATNWRWHDVTMISMELHVMSAAAWTGGLGAMAVLVAANRALLATALPRFSRLATVCIAAVAVTGLFNAVVELLVVPGRGLFGALFHTGYGVLVLLKIACMVGLAAVGANIRWRLLPAITAHKQTALVAWASMELAVMGLAFGFAVVLSRAPVS